MDLDRILNETLDGMWSNRSYGGFSDPPRKDFSPQSNQYGYNFSYQNNSPLFPPVATTPENTPSMAWPLQDVTSNFTDAFVALLEAGNKMENCLRLNPSNKVSKQKLNSLLNKCGEIMGAIRDLDAEVAEHFNLASKNLPALNPGQEQKPGNQPNLK